MDELLECQREIRRLRNVVRAFENKEFFIDTPLGKLKVWSSQTDNTEDFSGVNISFVGGNEDEFLLTCIKYDPLLKGICTLIYGEEDKSTPTDQILHFIDM